MKVIDYLEVLKKDRPIRFCWKSQFGKEGSCGWVSMSGLSIYAVDDSHGLNFKKYPNGILAINTGERDEFVEMDERLFQPRRGEPDDGHANELAWIMTHGINKGLVKNSSPVLFDGYTGTYEVEAMGANGCTLILVGEKEIPDAFNA